MIQQVMCESINMEAVRAYQAQSSSSKYRTALQCLVDRCGLDSSVMLSAAWKRGGTAQHIAVPTVLVFLVTVAVAAAYILLGKRRTEENLGAGAHLMTEENDKGVGYGSHKLV
jgi:hypothetical protein